MVLGVVVNCITQVFFQLMLPIIFLVLGFFFYMHGTCIGYSADLIFKLHRMHRVQRCDLLLQM